MTTSGSHPSDPARPLPDTDGTTDTEREARAVDSREGEALGHGRRDDRLDHDGRGDGGVVREGGTVREDRIVHEDRGAGVVHDDRGTGVDREGGIGREDRGTGVVHEGRVVREGGVDRDLERDAVVDATVPLTRQEATARQRERFGGMKLGSAFFGWLTATGAAVLLTALAVAVGAAVGVSNGTTLSDATNQAQQGTNTAQTVGLVGGVALLVILLIAYFCGGYVAGRMARFSGLKQGLGVWLWTIVIAIVVAVAAAVAGSKYNVLDNLNAFPRIPTGGNLTTGGIIALVAVALISLVGALLGGLAGMRYHRKVDQAAFEPLAS
jgi:hypothetical protein